jgi:hypothetical protein
MITAKCPMCEGEHFYVGRIKSPINFTIMLRRFFALRSSVPVRCRVCLSCGYVTPCVDHAGLVAIRKQSRREVIVLDEVPGIKVLPEL